VRLLEALEEVLPIVGGWWEDENDFYQLALAKGQDPFVTDNIPACPQGRDP